MSNRERWVVYPLLFLALSASLRDKITGHSQSLQYISGKGATIDLQHGVIQGVAIQGGQRVVGHEVSGETIRGNEIRGQRLTVDEIHCRSLAVLDSGGEPVVIISSGNKNANPPEGGSVRLYNGQGQSNCSLDAEGEGGVLTLGDRAGVLSLVLGHRGNASGLIAVSKEGKSAALSPLIQRPEKKGAGADIKSDAPKTGQPPEPAGIGEPDKDKAPQPSSPAAAADQRPT